MVTNLDRAEWAAASLRHFQCITGTEYEDALPDLLCDLMHWSERENVNFDEAIDTAHMHYEVEREDGSGEENLKDCKATVRSKNAAKAMTIAETAIYANLSALAEQLAEAAKLSTEAAAASKLGKQNQAIGTALPLEDLLSQARALYDAAITLHRHASRG
jgi:hypothetical protein